MKIFIDTANINEIQRMVELGIVDGVTTNPSLLAQESCKSVSSTIKSICDIVAGPVSVEVISSDVDGIIQEGKELSSIHKNVVVKLPLVKNSMQALKYFKSEGIRTNVTLCFSSAQGLLAAKAGATYISPFIGRLDDINIVGMELVHELVNMFSNYDLNTEIIVASIRNPRHVTEAALIGAHIATIPTKIIDTIFAHPLTDIGVKKFLSDWDKCIKSV